MIRPGRLNHLNRSDDFPPRRGTAVEVRVRELTQLGAWPVVAWKFRIGTFVGERVTVVVTISRPQLTQAVVREIGLSRKESAEMVESVLAEVSEALVRGETVKLSSFGSFSVRQKGQRMARNPKTGDEALIPPRRVLVFRPSHVLKKSINDSLVGGASTGAKETTQPENTEPDSTPLSWLWRARQK